MRRWEHQRDITSLAFLLILIMSAHCDADNSNVPQYANCEYDSVPAMVKLQKIFVWYASYGSNMNMQRFLCYIEGGQVGGMQRLCEGCRDKTRPTSTKWGTVPYRMFFGRNQTKAWGPGGVAFLDLQRQKKHKTYIRLYKINLQQFNDVLKQENDGQHVMTSPLFSLTELQSIIRNNGYRFVRGLKKGWYRTVLYLGQAQNLPVLTFTCPPWKIEDFRSKKLPICAPSKAYKEIMIKALVEEGKLPAEQAIAYIRDSYEKTLNGSHIHNSSCCHE
ncbi:hypothetical protein Pfo_011385 [Paulownia fortunei]|nr:hypothetical protein Pfo_011385 [Paulownia fortunei]